MNLRVAQVELGVLKIFIINVEVLAGLGFGVWGYWQMKMERFGIGGWSDDVVMKMRLVEFKGFFRFFGF